MSLPHDSKTTERIPNQRMMVSKNGVVGEWREWEIASLPTRREDEESAGGVGMWERTDNPVTLTTTQQ